MFNAGDAYVLIFHQGIDNCPNQVPTYTYLIWSDFLFLSSTRPLGLIPCLKVEAVCAGFRVRRPEHTPFTAPVALHRSGGWSCYRVTLLDSPFIQLWEEPSLPSFYTFSTPTRERETDRQTDHVPTYTYTQIHTQQQQQHKRNNNYTEEKRKRDREREEKEKKTKRERQRNYATPQNAYADLGRNNAYFQGKNDWMNFTS